MRKLIKILKKNSGRSKGKITVRHQGGRMKRFLREIDCKRGKKDIWATVLAIEYDPNRNASIAKLMYEDGQRCYIIAPEGLKIGSKVISSENAPIEVGNCLPLSVIPVGTQIHNIEIKPGKGGQIAKGAGCASYVFGREEKFVLVKIPSGEIRRFKPSCFATVGQVGNSDYKNKRIKNAGSKRRKGVRPTVRGVAMHPKAHPHGGGEGRSGIGLKYPKTPWGRKAVGITRKTKKYSDKYVFEQKRRGKKV